MEPCQIPDTIMVINSAREVLAKGPQSPVPGMVIKRRTQSEKQEGT